MTTHGYHGQYVENWQKFQCFRAGFKLMKVLFPVESPVSYAKINFSSIVSRNCTHTLTRVVQNF